MTPARLQAYYHALESMAPAQTRVATVGTAEGPSVYLSHARHEAWLVNQARTFLAAHGVDACVGGTCASASSRRSAIQLASRFVLLLGDEVRLDDWAAWELGLAEGIKGVDAMAVFPVAKDRRHWHAPGYVHSYPCLRRSRLGNWCIFRPASEHGIRLVDWLRG